MNKLKLALLTVGVLFSMSLAQGPVSVYGALEACKEGSQGRICGSKGAWDGVPVQVRGVSFGWSNTGWESAKFFNSTAVGAFVEGWSAEIVRAPLGVCDKESAGGCNAYGGYLAANGGKDVNINRVKAVVEAAIAKDVYVIIDWHTHEAQTAEAQNYFSQMIAWLKDNNGGSVPPNVIFEVYNEPINDSWAQIKTHATSVIQTIRNAGATNLVLVGTESYSSFTNFQSVILNKIADDNTGYVLHFYAADPYHENYKSYATNAINAGLSVFVSEYGTVDASGAGSHNASASDSWHSFMDTYKLSSCAWQVSDKNEVSAFFNIKTIDASSATAYTTAGNIGASGTYIKNKLNSYKETAPWRTGEAPSGSSSSGTGNSSSSSVPKDEITENAGFCYLNGEPLYCAWSGALTSECWQLNNMDNTTKKTCEERVEACMSGNSKLYVGGLGSSDGICAGGTQVTEVNDGTAPVPGLAENNNGECEFDGKPLYCRWDGDENACWKLDIKNDDETTSSCEERAVLCNENLLLNTDHQYFDEETDRGVCTGGDNVSLEDIGVELDNSSSSSEDEGDSSSSDSGEEGDSSSSSEPEESSSSAEEESSSSSSDEPIVVEGPIQLDDFESGSNFSTLGESFFVFTDAAADVACYANITNKQEGLNSEGKPNYVNFINEDGFIEMTGINVKNGEPCYYSQAAIGMDTKNNGDQYDLSQCTDGFSYEFRGAAHRVSIMSSLNNKQVAHTNEQVANTGDWKTVTLAQSAFAQDRYDATCNDNKGTCGLPLDLSKTESVQWGVRANVTGSYLQIRNVMCLGDLDLSDVEMPGEEPNESSSSSEPVDDPSSSSSEPKPSSSSGNNSNPSSSSSEDKTDPIISQFTDMGSLRVIAVGNNLVFGNLPSNAKIAVYNTHGQKQGTTNLAKGLYLVKVNSTIFKVPVK